MPVGLAPGVGEAGCIRGVEAVGSARYRYFGNAQYEPVVHGRYGWIVDSNGVSIQIPIMAGLFLTGDETTPAAGCGIDGVWPFKSTGQSAAHPCRCARRLCAPSISGFLQTPLSEVTRRSICRHASASPRRVTPDSVLTFIGCYRFACGWVSCEVSMVTRPRLRTWIARGKTALRAPARKPEGGTR